MDKKTRCKPTKGVEKSKPRRLFSRKTKREELEEKVRGKLYWLSPSAYKDDIDTATAYIIDKVIEDLERLGRDYFADVNDGALMDYNNWEQIIEKLKSKQ